MLIDVVLVNLLLQFDIFLINSVYLFTKVFSLSSQCLNLLGLFLQLIFHFLIKIGSDLDFVTKIN